MVDAHALFRFALRAIGLCILLGFSALLGGALLWAWPVNFLGFAIFGLFCYSIGRVHQAELARRPTETITALPSARARRRS